MSKQSVPLSLEEKRKILKNALQRYAEEQESTAPISAFQGGMLFLHQLQKESTCYHITHLLRLRGDLNQLALTRSIAEICKRHPSLRTLFRTAEGKQASQVIQPYQPAPLSIVDLRIFLEAERERQAYHLIRRAEQLPFQLTAELPFRYQLLHLQDQEYWLFLVVHHIIFDMFSLEIFLRELSLFYTSFSTGKPTPKMPALLSYGQFARWQAQWLQSEEAHAQLTYWTQQLASPPSPLELPLSRPQSGELSGKGKRYSLELPTLLTEKIRLFGQEEGATLFMTMLAAFNVLLYRCTRTQDILLGTPVAYRKHANFTQQIGLFLNELVLRSDLSRHPSFRAMVARTKQTVLEALSNQDMPFSQLVETLRPERYLDRNPFFQVQFSLENLVLDVHLLGLEATLLDYFPDTTKFALTLYIRDQVERLVTTFEYSLDLFAEEDIRRLAHYFHQLLVACMSYPDLPIEQLSLLTPIEQADLLSQGNTAPYPCVGNMCAVHLLIEEQAERHPDSLALVCNEQSLSYHMLNQYANRLAHLLISQGVQADTPVALVLDRSIEMVIALLAILKAGGTYVPLDPALPSGRLASLLDDVNASLVLIQGQSISTIPTSERTFITLDHDWLVCAEQPLENPEHQVFPHQLAYIIYTSGSTGHPKGVMISHDNLYNYICSLNAQFEGEQLHFATVSTLAADLGNTSIFCALTSGSCLHVFQYDTVTSSEAFAEEMQQKSIDVLKIVPSHLTALLAYGEGHDILPQRYLLLGGELFSRSLLTHLYELDMPCKVINHYGPTETTIGVLLNPLTNLDPASLQETSVPLGRPFVNTCAYVLDECLQPVPQGIAGELFIGGLQVGRGYFHNPEDTAARFIPDPFSSIPGARLYQTGDLVRSSADGKIVFLGRIDRQVKLRGFRIDLAEIETALMQHQLIDHAFVLMHERILGDHQLVAYLVATSQQGLDDATIRLFLKQILPTYMLPTYYITLPAFPLTPNGKIDRQALLQLPLPVLGDKNPSRPARSRLEQSLVEIWQDVLGQDQIDTQANFFDIGGHSLLVMQIHHLISQKLFCGLKPIDLFTYPTISTLAEYLLTKLQPVNPSEQTQATTQPIPVERQTRAIAIVGMAGRFPGAQDIQAFWENLRNGIESLSHFSPEELLEAGVEPEVQASPGYIPVKGLLEDATQFDAAFFCMTPRDAETMDPQQRIFLECAWEALEHAGYDPDRFPARIGVYASSCISTYYQHNLVPQKAYMQMVGAYQVSISNDKDFLASRTAYKLNLRGPAIAIQTGCSSSLVAIHMACQSILCGDCEMALAGGVALHVPLKEGYVYRQGEIMSSDGHCRAFDRRASGTVAGNGVGLVVLKPLEQALHDHDTIHAVIKGSAVNNDGSQKIGYTAPRAEGQAEAIRQAMHLAGVHPESISYIEAHGTATPLGDPIEIVGLTQAFQESGAERNQYCALGSVKTNIGHLDPAAGIAGLIKTVLALEQKQLPPSLHFEEANPAIDFTHSPFFVNTQLMPWEPNGSNPRRAGVSSFGIGGTNAHVILEEASEPLGKSTNRPWHLLLLSARSASALATLSDKLLEYLQISSESQLTDVAHTLQVGRKAFRHRQILICQDREDAIRLLTNKEPQRVYTGESQDQPAVVFLFPGQGAQHINMARELYTAEPVFQEQIDYCARYLLPLLKLDLRDILFPASAQQGRAMALLNETYLTQVALFTIEYALAQTWISWGIRPQAMIGHSIGEYVAACLAGVFTLDDALRLVTARGRLVQVCPKGAMLAVNMAEATLSPLLPDTLSLAALNTPHNSVVAGLQETVADLQVQLKAQDVECHLLHTSHAFHSPLIEPAMRPFLAEMQKIRLSPPTLPFVSNVSGTWISAQEATDPHYWMQHLRNPVRFIDGLNALLNDPFQLFLEVGPGRTLCTFTRQHPAYNNARHSVLCSLSHMRDKQSDLAKLYTTLGLTWLIGASIDWERFSAPTKGYRIPLPTYPFERQRYWIEAPPPSKTELHTTVSSPVEKLRPLQPEPQEESIEPDNELMLLLARAWQEVLGITPQVHDNFFDLGGDSLSISRIADRLSETLDLQITLDLFFEAQTIASQAQQLETLLLTHIEQIEQGTALEQKEV